MMETPKLQAIKAAYEDVGLPFVENVIFDNGWLKIKPTQYSSKYKDCDLLKLTTYVHSIRPKSLSGIENNNGWTRIESEEDLPKEYGPYHVKYENGQTVSWFNGVDFITLTGRKYKEDAITHYQPIETPKPPIF
ncbi:hypothetical protein [Elizabethkingia bruuniana]|uniref:hypothetical protein n=1 Tax=Elizabethkingia bruuniana TaxID=1756149 RepID=UPI0020128DC3|nr:hypothetical protein [Elizabethkingia bruuniana]MCL1636286.1 hypothetical protein [Elizabethkingia bruuniana]